MKRLALIAALAIGLTGCFADPNLNDRLAKENDFCLSRKMVPVYVDGNFTSRQPRIVCQPAKLSAFQQLEFMTWVAKRERAEKPVLMPEDLIHDLSDR